jgi:hypothetical protein
MHLIGHGDNPELYASFVCCASHKPENPKAASLKVRPYAMAA